MFNKTAAKLSPRLEKWIMETTDLDFELKYEPSRNELDPLDYISRHPMPEYRTRQHKTSNKPCDTNKILKLW